MSRPLEFPPGFLWGTASAAHQVEGGNRDNDWWEWEQVPGHIHGGESSLVAIDHYHRYRQDFQLLARLPTNAHRFSIEWSRVEPRPGEFDPREFAHYRDMLAALREEGLASMLTLHHFSSPGWFVKAGGWASAEAPESFHRFVRRTVAELGELVDLWCTINEPNIYAANGWMVGEFPPGRRGDVPGFYRVLRNLQRGHELAYRAIHQALPEARVGLSHHKFLFLPASPSLADRLAAATAQGFTDRWPEGPRLRPVWEATCDWIGVAHYWGQLAAFDPRRPQEQFIRRFNDPDLAVTEMGWPSHAPWMRAVLNEVRGLGKPVYITENGISCSDDRVRQRYLVEILEQVHAAIGDGVDVRGYFHWTAFDNFEWARGYGQRFGLVSVDRPTLAREIKPSGRLYGLIARANAVPVD